MNVRDLSQYVSALCGKEEQLGKLGTNDEPLLLHIYGHDQAEGQLEAIIQGVASFASNAEEQLFYEFVQNAYDADADTLIFNANEDYLAVYNNGKPFYTDLEAHPEKEGQLFSFIGKGKSAKRNDEDLMGKFGQGSKLLYTLLTDVSDSVEEGELLVETIKERKKGPYLISWNSRNQLANLLQERGEWRQAQADDYKRNILFAKIVLSYYPLAPGRAVTEEWFSAKEALDAVKALKTLIDPRIKINYLDRGTALIIPLGKGKYGRITNEENKERVRTRIGGFSTITKVQKKKKELEHIWVMGKEVETTEAEPVAIDFKNDGHEFHYLFAFNPIFAGKNYVNLFKGLPILDTKYQLGFIIDNDIFELDNSRQRISDKEKTRAQLTWAFRHLADVLKEMMEKEPKKFDYVYKSLLATQCEEGTDADFATEPFRQEIEPFFKLHVLTTTGEYVEEGKIREFMDDYPIPLEGIGVTEFKWVDPGVRDDLERHGISVKKIDFSTLLGYADPMRLEAWIRSLREEEYKEFHKMCDKYKEKSRRHKLFRSNLGNIYSYDELRSRANIYYPMEEGMSFGECEHITQVVNEVKSDYLSILYGKIEQNIVFFRQSDSLKEDAANLLAWIVEKDKRQAASVKKIALLPNRHGEYVTFSNLLASRPTGTTLFDNYVVRGYTPPAVRGWLLMPDGDRQGFWKWVGKNWKEIKRREAWGGENTAGYIKDIKKVYPANEKKLSLYLDEEGLPIEEKREWISNVSRLTEDEYDYLNDNLCHDLMPYRYEGLLNEAFGKTYKSARDIIGKGIEADTKLLRIICKIINDYMDKYRTQQVGERFAISQLNRGKNYVDSVESDLEEELLNAKFYRVPDMVLEMKKDVELSDYKMSSNQNLLVNAIRSIEHPIMLLPIVEMANHEVKEVFFGQLDEIVIDENIGKDDLKWRAIKLAKKDEFEDEVFGKLRHKGKELPKSIISRYVSVGKHVYDIYELNEEYETENQRIDSFLDCLPDRGYFIDYFLEEKEISAEDFYNSLNVEATHVTIKQLEFCIDYLIENDEEGASLEIENEDEAPAALDMISEREFKNFDKYFIIPGVDYDKHVYADEELLMEEELLPGKVRGWIDQHNDALKLFSRLTCEKNAKKRHYITVRRALLNDKAYSNFAPFEEDDMAAEIDAAIKWAMSRAFAYVYDSHRYETMMGIIEHLPDDYQDDNDMPMLRYTGEVEEEPKGKPKPLFALEWYDSDNPMLSYKEWGNGDFRQRLGESEKLKELFGDNEVYLYKDDKFLLRHGFTDNPLWTIEMTPVGSHSSEFDHPVYRKWKEDKEASGGYKIYTAMNPIKNHFNIISSDSDGPVFSEMGSGGDVVYDKKKKIVIVNLPESRTLKLLMRMIADNISGMDFFKEPFIALQSLYIEELEGNGQEGLGMGGSSISIEKSVFNKESEAQQLINHISVEAVRNIDSLNEIADSMGNEENMKKLAKAAEVIKILIETLDEEQLRQLANNIDDIVIRKPKEKKAKVNSIIGCIGEMIYKHYLDKKDIAYDYAAEKGEGAYDFDVNGMYVDVKTTIETLIDGTVPFYLHSSQAFFLKEHPDDIYHIIRISLADLHVVNDYKEVRSEYGSDASPNDNPDLRRRCEKIAEKYWRKASTEDFEALSPEYAIAYKRE